MTEVSSRLIAVATRDPLDAATFSGLSRNLFSTLQDLGYAITPITTRDLRPQDYLSGALNLAGFARGQFRGRRAPKINPNWYWSRRGTELMWRRFDATLAAIPGNAPILQIGTHVKTLSSRRRSYCLTDATVVQAVAADEFSIARARGRVIADAIECQREVFESCDKIFVLSEWAKSSVVADYGIAADRVFSVGAGANVSTPLPRNIDITRPYILFVGADWNQKGGPLLLEAFGRVRARIPTSRLIVVGCRPAISEPGVEVIGPLDRKDPTQRDRLFKLYAAASAFSILPKFDAFPNVLLEAGFYGVPVVSTAEGSRAEAVVDEVTGLLAKDRDADQVAQALSRVLLDVSLAQRLGAAARARVETHFSWPAVAGQIARQMGLSVQPDPTAVNQQGEVNSFDG